jgi:hypothetical protein
MPTKNTSQKIVLTDTWQRVTAVKVAVKWSCVACLCRVSNFDTGQRQSLPSVSSGTLSSVFFSLHGVFSAFSVYVLFAKCIL